MKTLFDKSIQEKFEEFDRANPKVWGLFVQFAFRAINRGFNHYGAKTIFEAIRYYTDVHTTDPEFKLNNNYTAYYARKFMAEYPDYDGFFETRKVKL